MAVFQNGTTLLPHFATTELDSCQRDSMPYKAENIYYPALYRKCLLNSDLRCIWPKTTYILPNRQGRREENETAKWRMSFKTQLNSMQARVQEGSLSFKMQISSYAVVSHEMCSLCNARFWTVSHSKKIYICGLFQVVIINNYKLVRKKSTQLSILNTSWVQWSISPWTQNFYVQH